MKASTRWNFAIGGVSILALSGGAALMTTQHGQAQSGTVTAPRSVKLGKLPDSAEVVYHGENGYIYVMDRNGQNVEQITFGRSRRFEHAAISYDRRYLVANEHGDPKRPSILWLFDLQNGTEVQLVPNFAIAGEGGVDWDPQGFIYFAGLTEQRRGPNTDIYRIKFDGTGLQRLTQGGAAHFDVSTSSDGRLICYVKVVKIGTPEMYTELWMAASNGDNARLVYRAGKVRVASAHDPEFSPDNKKIVFSMVNSSVPPNFPKHAEGSTAHDLYTINIDGTGLARLTEPGPISIIPDWKGDLIVYTELSDRGNYRGTAVVSANGKDQKPRRTMRGANSAKWIP